MEENYSLCIPMDSSAHVGADRGSQSKTSHLIYTLVSVFVCVCAHVFISALSGRERTTREQRRVEIRKEVKFLPRLSVEKKLGES